jgi:hypothetical protein
LVRPFCRSRRTKFSDALGGAHNVRGPNSLVRGDHDEVLDPVLCCGHSHVIGPEDVVLDRLENVRFHEGDMLVGSGMIDNLWPILTQDVVQAGAILNAPNLRMEGNLRESLAHFAIDFEQRGLGDFKSDNPGRVKACDLSAKFGTDGSRRAGNEDDFAFERATNLVFFKAYRGPSQEILDCHLADLTSEAAPLNYLGQPWHSLALHPRLVAQL